MTTNFDDIDELIGKHLARETDEAENERLGRWLSESESNRKYYEHLRLLFEKAASVKSFPQFDTDLAWQKMRSGLSSPRGRQAFLRPRNTRFFLRLAAGLLLLASVGYLAFQFFTPAPAVELSSGNTATSDTLPDGTTVFLNKQTTINYRFDRERREHRVAVQGEAHFEIQNRGRQDFVVEVENVFIKDIGTVFNVKAYPGADTVRVDVQEGEVMLFTAGEKGVAVKAGQAGIYERSKEKFSVTTAEANAIAYKTRVFTFTDADLATVASALNSVYEKKVRVPAHLADCRITVAFDNESIDAVADVIAETLGLSIKAEGNSIVLEGTGCEK